MRKMNTCVRFAPALQKLSSFFQGNGVVNFCSTANQVQPKPDKLYKKISVEVRGHEPAVLKSYQTFVTIAAQELDITIDKILEPKKHLERRTLLKSVFVHKKHMVQYEMRTHFKIFELKHLTGSTADTFLEYIQRNVPEGVGMKVTKHCIEPLPENILRTPTLPNRTNSKESSS